MNFFTWIREGVRQAVLYGVTDAVGDIGAPPESEDVSQHLLEVIRTSNANLTATATAEAPKQIGMQAPKRRKLGRSLTDIQAGVASVEPTG